MAFAETANLAVKLSLGGNFTSQMGKATKSLQSFDRESRGFKAGAQIGTGIKRSAFIAVAAIGTVTTALAVAVKDGQEAANVQKIYANAIVDSYKSGASSLKDYQKQLDALQKTQDKEKPGSKAFKATDKQIKTVKLQMAAAGPVTAAYTTQLNAQQKALEDLAGVDDELIKSEQTRLIQMGFNGAATKALTPLILDTAKATGKDLLTVTVAAGKAANGNATALQRLGIMVDKVRFKANPLGETMRVLNQRFGGTTKALSGSFDVRVSALREHLKDISEDVGIKLLPALTRIVGVVGQKVVPAFGSFVDRILPEVNKGLDEFATALENGGAENAIRGITDALGPMIDLVKVAAAPVKAIVQAFLSLPKEVQTVLVGAFAVNKLTGGLVTNAAGGIIEAIGKGLIGGIKAPLVNVEGAVVNVNGGVGGVPGGAAEDVGKVIGGSIAGDIAAGFATIGIGTVAGLIIAPASIAALGIAITNASDPEGKRQLAGRQQTAAARGLNPNNVSRDRGAGAPGSINVFDGWVKAQQATTGNLEEAASQLRNAAKDFRTPKEIKHHNKVIDKQEIASHARNTAFTGGKAPAATQDIETLRGKIAAGLAANAQTTAAAVKDVDSTVAVQGRSTASAALSAGNNVAAAIHGIQAPVTNVKVDVNVTAGGVQKTVVVQNRYGPATGSRSSDPRWSGYTPGGA